ncbi:MAG: glycine--tRNA ligase subunit beta [Deltaproteobacteria bacterium]|nr:glycine--tRNA ligase subunit beta [Deltaproteobacteria bacterium]
MSQTTDFLLEVGTEEIPAGFLSPALGALASLAREGLEARRLAFGEVVTAGTPRRLVLLVRGLAKTQPDAVEEKVGPPASAAFDKDGNPTKAAEGFARTNGVAVADLLRIDTGKGLYLAVRKEVQGRPAAEVLSGLLPAWLAKVPFRKSMRWGSLDTAFARPVHWIVALLGGEVVPFEFANIASGRASRGHRFHAPEPFDVMDADDYLHKIREAHVVVDPAERRRAIAEQVAFAASSVGGTAIPDEELLDTVTYLVEDPVAVVGSFEPRYLELPRELLILTMKTHQKYFAVVNAAGTLVNHFVTISNTRARDLGVVAKGNERVLRARLADARFFFEEDQKKSLEAHAEGLKTVVFQAKLGTSHEKVERFRAVAKRIGEALCPDRLAFVDRIALLCKADLVSLMVGEFPELQGVIGREYAFRGGEDPAVARGIQEHYWPVQAGSAVPSTPEARAVSMADKLDTLCGCFGVGLIPSGTADPYALRRQTLAILRILLEGGYRLRLGWLVEAALAELAGKLTRPADDVKADVLAFFRGRLEGLLDQAGLSADLVAAVLDVGFDDVVDARSRIQALEAARRGGDLTPLAETFKRVANILKGQATGAVAPEVFADPAEADLWRVFGEVRRALDAAAGRGDYAAFLREAARLKGAVDAFFDAVLVMAEDPAVRDNRLALLGAVADQLRALADFARIAA